MSLADVIVEIENGTFDRSVNTTVTPAIEIQIREELAIASMHEARETLFSDAKILHDRIIEKYLSLDQETRQFMADVYVREEVFREKAIVPTGTKRRLKNEFSKYKSPPKTDLFLLLQHISSYSKIIPVLKQYIADIKKLKNPKISNTYMRAYLTKCGLITWTKHDFARGSQESLKSSEIFVSITHGLSEGLKQEVHDAMTLKHHRTKILKQYIKDMKKHKTPKPSDTWLQAYLKKIKLNSWTEYDFPKMEWDKSMKKEDVFPSVTHDLSEELKQQVQDMITLKYHRQKILQQYIKDMKKLKKPKTSDTWLQAYLRKIGLHSWTCYDFESSITWQNSKNKRDAFSSLTHELSEELKQQVQDMITLKYHRTKTLQQYVTHFESVTTVNKPSLYVFLSDNKLHGLHGRDFSKGKGYTKGEQRDQVKSIAHGITDKELVAKVRKYDARARKQ